MVRVRFAPSPTGIPHIGNTRTALYNYLFAKHNKGKFIIRIEDTDRQRLVPESLDKILQILEFVGIKWDEGPGKNGPYAPYVQSKRLKIYQDHAHDLVKKDHAYYCFCTPAQLQTMRKNQQKQNLPSKYNRNCLKLSQSDIKEKLNKKTPFVIRLKTPQSGITQWQDLIQGKISFDNKNIDDQILLKSDGYPTYHLAVVIDDYLMKISHILRGPEWISSTPKHILLYQSFGWDIPKIGHFSLILGPDKKKLSKRHGAKSALDYQDEGYLPEALIAFMAYLGWSYQDNSQILSMDKMIKLFQLKNVQKSNPIFDQQKLDYFNAKYIRSLSISQLLQLIKPYLKFKIGEDKLKKILPLIQERLIKLTDVNYLTEYFVKDITTDVQLIKQQSKKPPSEIKSVLNQIHSAYSAVPDSDLKADRLDQVGHQLLETTGWKPRELFMTIRVAVTGRTATPPLFDTMEVLGKSLVLERLKQAQKNI